MKTVDLLLDESGLDLEDLAEKARLTVDRAEAIAVGRWTPSPKERQRIADVFNVSPDEVSWGHTMDPRNVRYRQFGFRKKKKFD